jgi:hypothetical protein
MIYLPRSYDTVPESYILTVENFFVSFSKEKIGELSEVSLLAGTRWLIF